MIVPKQASSISRAAKEHAELAKALEIAKRLNARRFLSTLYPDEGPLRRELYPKHLEFFAAGGGYRQRCFMGANRIGKTIGVGGYELTLHLTGRYPDWWRGKRFNGPIEAWAAGKTNETTRDIIQAKLCGPVKHEGQRRYVTGTGLIPGEDIGAIEEIGWKSGVQDLIDTMQVKHATGGWSILGFKAYQQGRGSFEGTHKDIIWLDEEAPEDVYGECLIRTAGTKGDGSDDGIIMLTFTPLEGLSKVVMGFLPAEMRVGA